MARERCPWIFNLLVNTAYPSVVGLQNNVSLSSEKEPDVDKTETAKATHSQKFSAAIR
jgi:hypothetical protein